MDSQLFNTSRRALAKYGCGRKRKMLDHKTFGEIQLPILAMHSVTQAPLSFQHFARENLKTNTRIVWTLCPFGTITYYPLGAISETVQGVTSHSINALRQLVVLTCCCAPIKLVQRSKEISEWVFFISTYLRLSSSPPYLNSTQFLLFIEGSPALTSFHSLVLFTRTWEKIIVSHWPVVMLTAPRQIKSRPSKLLVIQQYDFFLLNLEFGYDVWIGGRHAAQYLVKSRKGVICGEAGCNVALPGVSSGQHKSGHSLMDIFLFQIKHMDLRGFKNCKKREKTVSRAYGGSRCHTCVRQRWFFTWSIAGNVDF